MPRLQPRVLRGRVVRRRRKPRGRCSGAVLVRNGEMVRAGQPLLQIRDDALQEQIANIERMRRIWLKEV
ncbi:MAG: biotin/lipoyl-binding protein, partial [Prochlorococcaceae cyanobacterium]